MQTHASGLTVELDRLGPVLKRLCPSRLLPRRARQLPVIGLTMFALGIRLVTAQSSANPAGVTNATAPADWPDAGEFLDTAYKFVPLLMPITEPAVGYGAAGGLIFIDKQPPKSGPGFQKPNLAAVGGMATENGSWAALAGYSRSWWDGQLETLVGAAYGSINLDFYGIGDDALNRNPISYNLEPVGGLVEARYRLGRSPARIGLGYSIASTKVSFNGTTLPPAIQAAELDSRVAGLTPKLIYDTRDTIFTPTKGIYAQADCGLFREALGGDFDYEKVSLSCIGYLPVTTKLTLGLRADGNFSFDDAPFYVRPFINLRGVAAFRYLGEHAGEVELEARWQFWQRFSLVGFTGAGLAWNDFDHLEHRQGVVTGGVGCRYELVHKYGLHIGLDVAFGPDDPVFYVQFGSAWFRP